jgi:hypothetical protein
MPNLLSVLLISCPVYVPAAIKGNIFPGLIHTLSEIRSHPNITGDSAKAYMALECPLDCLLRLMQYDKKHGREIPATAITGLLPLFLDLFPLGDTRTKVYLTLLSGDALALAPAEDAGRWGPGLLRAIALLVRGSQPADTHAAVVVDTLMEIFRTHPELLADCRAWRIEDSLKRLKRHGDPDMAGKAALLLEVLSFVMRDRDVSSNLATALVHELI